MMRDKIDVNVDIISCRSKKHAHTSRRFATFPSSGIDEVGDLSRAKAKSSSTTSRQASQVS